MEGLTKGWRITIVVVALILGLVIVIRIANAVSGGGASSNYGATVTSCGLDGNGDPTNGYQITNSTGQPTQFYVYVGYYQDGSEFATGNDTPDISAGTTYNGTVDDSSTSPPNSDPISCQILTVTDNGAP